VDSSLQANFFEQFIQGPNLGHQRQLTQFSQIGPNNSLTGRNAAKMQTTHVNSALNGINSSSGYDPSQSNIGNLGGPINGTVHNRYD
jgi:hypothetical protein